MRKISKDMIIADLVTIDPNIVVILMRAAMVHGLDVDLLVDQINDYLAQ